MKPFLAALAVSISFGAIANGQAQASSADAWPLGSAASDGAQRPEATRKGDPGSTPGCSTTNNFAGSPANHWPIIGKVQTASLVALALADYHSTQRGLARGGREVGLVLSCGGQLCQGRYAAINVGVVLGTYAITRYAIPRLPQRWRRVTNIMLSGMITGRGFIVVQNYRKAARIK